jgi:beta-galactosidase
MKKTRLIAATAACLLLLGSCGGRPFRSQSRVPAGRDIRFNDGWKFKRCETAVNGGEGFQVPEFNDASWEPVALPHTPRIEPLVVNDQWQGICWYRKHFELDGAFRGKKVFIAFEGAMHTADVWINGVHAVTHRGGFLPFLADITSAARFDRPNLIAVRLDNRDDPEVPPGKALADLDFCTYGGLYRNVTLRVTDRLHITDAVDENRTAGGGVFVRILDAGPDRARVRVQVHAVNENPDPRTCTLHLTLADRGGRTAAEGEIGGIVLGGLEDRILADTLDVQSPMLWSPGSPSLYTLRSAIRCDGRTADFVDTRIGIRRFGFDGSKRFLINGKPFDLRGTNRHQEYPYIGYALPDAAQIRDARKIKQAGFDFVRLSHYPHAPAFLDACDELGIVVMDAIPGWQFFGNGAFRDRSLQDCRDMIRRDRNHPCVAFWEVSLNESDMPPDFMEACQAVARAEFPGDQCLAAGWRDFAYDVFIPARQHAAAPDYWKRYAGSRPLIIAEYGDWEYYAQNAGFNQAGFRDLSPDERNSRQLRGSGEKRLLQQALNFQEALNDNLGSPAAGSANWLMFDYNRGYADDIEASGICDIFRIPKPAFHFYRSQRPAGDSAPMVFIADSWAENNDSRVKVFSNCDRVTLLVNGKPAGTREPDRDSCSGRLAHPPFTFPVQGFRRGSLEAVGFIGGRKAASHRILSPGTPEALKLSADCADPGPRAGGKDVFFAYAAVVDGNGTTVPSASDPVRFALTGPGRLIGDNPARAEAGIAAILVESTGERGALTLRAASGALDAAGPLRIRVK